MAEPRTVVDDARNLIQGNPLEWAAYKLGYQAGVAVVFGDDHNKLGALALAYLAIAAQDPHPDAYTLDELDAIDAAATRVQLAVQALRYARRARTEASLLSFDDAEAQVQSAARELGRALGGAR